MADRTPATGRTRSTSEPQFPTPRPPVSSTRMCGFAAMSLSLMPSWKPVITARTTISALTPRKTPPMPIQTNSDRLLRLPRARR